MLTAREAARWLGCSVQYVRRLLRSGRLRGRKIGRDWIVEDDVVARWSAVRAAIPLFYNRGHVATRQHQRRVGGRG
jgi:excisionase family DNA binding protein